MKRTLNKIKATITALWIAIGSFCFKVMAQFGERETNGPTAGIAPYNIYITEDKSWASWWIAIKIAQRTLVGVTLIVWIINLIKIKKTGDKEQKKKKIKKAIIIMSILIVILVAAFLIPTLLLQK